MHSSTPRLSGSASDPQSIGRLPGTVRWDWGHGLLLVSLLERRAHKSSCGKCWEGGREEREAGPGVGRMPHLR